MKLNNKKLFRHKNFIVFADNIGLISYRNDPIKRPAFLSAPRISAQVIFLKLNKSPALFKQPPLKRGRLIENYLKKVGAYLKLLSSYRRENKNTFPMF